jgi:uncharacterized protein (TIGR03083 family)
VLDLGSVGPDPAAPMLRQRARLGATLAGLGEEEWAHPSRCDGWSTRDVVAHLITTNGFWSASIRAARAGSPTRYLATFDPVATPAQLVDATREQPAAEVLAQYEATCADLAEAVDGLTGDGWDLPGEAPPGHVALRAVVTHALWDGWIHERDIVLPLGRRAVEEGDEVAAVLRYAAALGPGFLAMVGDERPGTLVVDATDPEVQLTVLLGSTVVVRDGLPEGEAPVRLTGSAVGLTEALSHRAPLTAEVAAEHRWMLDGLATVFDQAG